MINLIVITAALSATALAAMVGSVVIVARDGYRRLPTRHC